MRIGLDTSFLIMVTLREHPGHGAAHAELQGRLSTGDALVIAPQVVSEFVHVASDPRRFQQPLTVPEALSRAQAWWEAEETENVLPSPDSLSQFWSWMAEFSLGRKRILDTMLAATYFTHQVTTILSSNARDFRVFGCFHVVNPS